MVQAGTLRICSQRPEKAEDFSGVILLVLKQGRHIAYFFLWETLYVLESSPTSS